ncbi:hypothetical protein KFK09_018592 [Dendrobium nobile]|uniref:Cleavage and polyadenylation specificity factor subunit 2 n=1 Tax=Dendrobium nobile TaxID=94219 RepID=A0A8T3AW64_DENNO|nr:hypothetical protein KFK09_018592 [Dendrobium nobile]
MDLVGGYGGGIGGMGARVGGFGRGVRREGKWAREERRFLVNLQYQSAMGTSVQLTPLCGVYSENPLCYLLSIDGFNFLMDCGWNDLCDTNLLQPLSKVSSIVDAVLLSHPDMLHIGALPYAIKHLGLSAPVYATEPVYRLGLLTMYDYYLSRRVSILSLSSWKVYQRRGHRSMATIESLYF